RAFERGASPGSLDPRALQAIVHERHQVRHVGRRVGAGLRALQHDRTERARHDDRTGARGLELLEALLADALPFFVLLEQEPAARPATEGILTIPHRLDHRRTDAGEQVAWLIDASSIASEITRIVTRN